MKRKDSNAKVVWSLFDELCEIPRASGKEQAVALWLEAFAAKHGFSSRKDKVGNVVIAVPATAACQDSPTLVIQGHIDMVCEKTPESDHNFDTDPLTLIEKEGWLCADNTTLGADNGIGVVIGMALAIEPGLEHGPLELLFTVDEETGLTGVQSLAPDFVTGRQLLNLDTEEDGEFIVGCAGGAQTDIKLDLSYDAAPGNLASYVLSVSGLRGGHSGLNIGDQRANAIGILARTLDRLIENDLVHISTITGGSAHNAIARDSQATIYLAADSIDKVNAMLNELTETFKQEYSNTDPDMAITLAPGSGKGNGKVMTPATARAAINLLLAIPHGVHGYSRTLAHMVETSNNLATATTSLDDNMLSLLTSQRSSQLSRLHEINTRITAIVNLSGGRIEHTGFYAAWEPAKQSKLKDTCAALYEELFGKPPKVDVVHAGLECGVLGKKYPGMDMISMGPTILNAHSPQECVNIQSVDRIWQFTLALLPKLATN